MRNHIFSEFLTSDDTLRVYETDRLIFSSDRDGLLPLLDYIERLASRHQGTIIFDKIMGNAAALLSVKAGCREVHSPTGSALAIRTLEANGITYHLTKVVPHIQSRSGEGMCPTEKLSIDKSPGEFYESVRTSLGRRNK